MKTEKEKMLAGERYNCLDADLESERQKVEKLLRLYNLTEDAPERQTILQQLLVGAYRRGFRLKIDPRTGTKKHNAYTIITSCAFVSIRGRKKPGAPRIRLLIQLDLTAPLWPPPALHRSLAPCPARAYTPRTSPYCPCPPQTPRGDASGVL